MLNTLHPEYLAQIMFHANEQRMSSTGDSTKAESIRITEFWEEQLKAMPYLSRKFLGLFTMLNSLMYFQRRMERPSTCSSLGPSKQVASRPGRSCHSWAPSVNTRNPSKSLCQRSNSRNRRHNSQRLFQHKSPKHLASSRLPT